MADGANGNGLVRLSDQTLSVLPGGVARPTYNRQALTAGIVHIGLGNFHRAHQAWYLHRLMQMGKAQDWAIIGAGVRAADSAQRSRLLGQDCLTTLIELDPAGMSAEVSGAMIDFLPVAADNAPLIAQMADPEIRIVSLTVTEGGYYVDPASGGFDAGHADITHDAAHPGSPRTAFGAIIAALGLRRVQGTGPFTVMSCDNLQSNGDVLRQTVLSLARMSDPALADWIAAECSFPNSMVDCIVPATGTAERALANRFGIDDAAPVTHENFRQWVIEDDFCAGRPPLEEAGATFCDDVHQFEAMKLRILNGGHQIIAAAGDLLGIETIAQTMDHPLIRQTLRKIIQQEIAPHVADVPGMSPLAYLDLIDRRFANPEIRDTTRRVAYDGSSRQPGFILPSARDGLAAGTPVSGLALVSAIWARYCLGTREDGTLIEANDPNWQALTELAKQAAVEPDLWLAQRQIYGDLSSATAFAAAFSGWMKLLHSDGVEATLTQYLDL